MDDFSEVSLPTSDQWKCNLFPFYQTKLSSVNQRQRAERKRKWASVWRCWVYIKLQSLFKPPKNVTWVKYSHSPLFLSHVSLFAVTNDEKPPKCDKIQSKCDLNIKLLHTKPSDLCADFIKLMKTRQKHNISVIFPTLCLLVVSSSSLLWKMLTLDEI